MGESLDLNGERSLPDKITALKNIAKSYEMKMRGYRLDTSNSRWVIAGKALAGERFITQSSGIIFSFAENGNLMTGKTEEKFMMEFADAFYRTNTQILNDESIPQDTYRACIKMFKDTLSNIGDIIKVSREVLKDIFKQYEYRETEGEYN